MGQKANPIGLRINIIRTWDSRWFAGRKEYAKRLHEDLAIRNHLEKTLANASISKITIERPAKKVRITLFTSKPGVIIGKKGADIEKIRKALSKFTKDEISVNLVEIRKPEIDAALIAQGIASQLERRISFRRAMKRATQSAMRYGAEGIRVNCSGRLGGAEIARMEWYREGRVPLHTLRADIDYATYEANTTYGVIGVKVWVFKGEVKRLDPMAHEKRLTQGQGGNERRSSGGAKTEAA